MPRAGAARARNPITIPGTNPMSNATQDHRTAIHAPRTTPSRRPLTLAALSLCLLSSAAMAASPPQLAAEQLAIDRSSNTGVGDGIGQEFAQGFQLQQRGYVGHIMLPLNCLTSPTPTLRVTLQAIYKFGKPGGRVLATQDVPGHVLDTWSAQSGQYGLRMVKFRRPPLLDPGAYAFTVSATGGICLIWYAKPGDTYPGGEAWLSTLPGAQPGTPADWNVALGRDLAFQVFVEPL